MDFIISFFRDDVAGFWYVLYILACIFFIFVLLGIVGDRKRAVIAEKLKEKRARDIASGEVARIAALESKQVLDVLDDTTLNPNANIDNNNLQNTENLAKKEEVPAVLTISSDGSSNSNMGSVSNTVVSTEQSSNISNPTIK